MYNLLVQLRIAKVKQTTTNGIDSTYGGKIKMKKDSRSLFQNILAIAVPLRLRVCWVFWSTWLTQLWWENFAQLLWRDISGEPDFLSCGDDSPGIAAGASVLISQAWGKGGVEQDHKVLAYAYRTALVFVVI